REEDVRESQWLRQQAEQPRLGGGWPGDELGADPVPIGKAELPAELVELIGDASARVLEQADLQKELRNVALDPEPEMELLGLSAGADLQTDQRARIDEILDRWIGMAAQIDRPRLDRRQVPGRPVGQDPDGLIERLRGHGGFHLADEAEL